MLFGSFFTGIAGAHEDHPVPSFSEGHAVSTNFNSGGEGAEWELLASFATGNPHTDIDFFTQDGDTYASAGTLGIGPNGGGQTIVKLTEGDEVSPSYVAGHPSASCLSNPEAALGLQHDVESSPKGDALLNTTNPLADRRDAQIIVDATDAEGRCHDQGAVGVANAPRGGLEIVDITDVANPVEIGLTSHIGEAHTVNIDPKRPHIAYAVTSDGVSLNPDLSRQNEDPEDSDRFDLDGFEVVDMSSCMNFPAGTTVTEKRQQCRPEVFRYRYPTVEMSVGHTSPATVYGCHELEVYPNDQLTCGSGQALIVLDMSRAFDDNGTPRNYLDDKPRGDALPCRVRESTSLPLFTTGASVTDCVVGEQGGEEVELHVANWLDIGAPSIDGVKHVGTVHHMGRGAGNGVTTAFGPKEDIDFNHEAEFTHSRDFVLATDERGGGVAPPGAACSPGVDNPEGNGGIHAYRADRLSQDGPGTPEEAWEAYARTPQGEKAIFRAEIHTQPQASICTAHVFQQIPDQNRIFMGWYSQGTRVVDYTENKDGTFEFKEAGYFIPEEANTWVSHVFKYERNQDCTYTYYGATGDFNIGAAGRNAIDVYKVTLPKPPGDRCKPKKAAAGGGKKQASGAGPGSGSGTDDEVKGTVLSRDVTAQGAGALAATGAELATLCLLALVLLVLGSLASRYSNEHEDAPVERIGGCA
jgi:hypothetical protein